MNINSGSLQLLAPLLSLTFLFRNSYSSELSLLENSQKPNWWRVRTKAHHWHRLHIIRVSFVLQQDLQMISLFQLFQWNTHCFGNKKASWIFTLWTKFGEWVLMASVPGDFVFPQYSMPTCINRLFHYQVDLPFSCIIWGQCTYAWLNQTCSNSWLTLLIYKQKSW